MKAQSVAGFGAAGFLIVVAQVLTGFGGPLAQLAAGLVGGLLALALLRFFEVRYDQWWVPAALAGGATFIGAGISLLTSPASTRWLLVAVPIVAALAAGAPGFIRQSSAAKCGLCGRPVRRDINFDCPRCGFNVCDQCWRFESLRCRLCDDNKVPAFPADHRWWRERLGPPAERGQCQVCQTDTSRDTLYACPRCRRTQCRACWDDTNGECQRCRWLIEDLPPALEDLMAGQGRRE